MMPVYSHVFTSNEAVHNAVIIVKWIHLPVIGGWTVLLRKLCKCEIAQYVLHFGKVDTLRTKLTDLDVYIQILKLNALLLINFLMTIHIMLIVWRCHEKIHVCTLTSRQLHSCGWCWIQTCKHRLRPIKSTSYTILKCMHMHLYFIVSSVYITKPMVFSINRKALKIMYTVNRI